MLEKLCPAHGPLRGVLVSPGEISTPFLYILVIVIGFIP